MSGRGFTTNSPAEVIAHTGVDANDMPREALLVQLRVKDEAIDDLRNENAELRAERDRWVAYNGRLNARIEAAREALK